MRSVRGATPDLCEAVQISVGHVVDLTIPASQPQKLRIEYARNTGPENAKTSPIVPNP